MIAPNSQTDRCLDSQPTTIAPSLDTTAVRPVDLHQAQRAVRQLLIALGEDPDREGLRETPKRAAKAMVELMAGRFESAAAHLARSFTHRGDDLVIVRDIEFFSLCEHHLLPFVGQAHIAYLPGNNQVVGLSKLARVVDVYARRPQLQERMTDQIADAMMRFAEARGVVVVVEAQHMCMKMRGVGKHNSTTQTVAVRGLFKDQSDLRAETLAMLMPRKA